MPDESDKELIVLETQTGLALPTPPGVIDRTGDEITLDEIERILI